VAVVAVVTGYGILFLVGEIAARRLKISPELTRPYIHALAGLFAIAAAIMVTREELILLSLCFLIALFASKRLALLTSIHGVQRATWGELYFPAGVGLAALLYLPQHLDLYNLAVLIMALSDPLANLLGNQVKSPALVFGKSLFGSAMFFLGSFAISLFSVSPLHALVVAALVTLIEAISPYGSDNLTIIPAVGIAVLIL
jgi:phytol kinase